MANRNQLIVKESRKAMDQLKYEISAELGTPIGSSFGSSGFGDTEFASELGEQGSGGHAVRGYYGHMTSRETGAIGGHMTRKLVRDAESTVSRS